MNDEKRQSVGSAGRPGNSGRAGSANGRDPLADRAHRVLQQLPSRRAPLTLAPRVMAELMRRAQLAWYRRPWTDWPEAMRWLSTLILAGIVAGTMRLLEGGWTASKNSPALTAVHEMPVFLETAEISARSLLTLLHTLPPAWWIVGGCTLGIVCAGTLGLGTAAWRLARSATH